ncbi:MAG: hypothetical protein COW24_03575 [Candidatus Kerfeldbacteria bacterium CG15_BIG_FIL_POST_REV_8_21_14_020_45_12]|uniref:ATP-grasp domain-containing protein n=1 Tax=Candidatus Kerfeldbacteria bacterium CG15_BIG_FIL_POST_REV_8_21_14_020_45_12 TaxID=2014247 RepID=A0A2M7H3D0_9BACT|nr:MAG: hypothetical protein COW24_03575 [Candidatus Kerfeldbacteria bacterium CG15_BIG_FIL_POST_REV_8_21_14_020_45_12]PJA93749.1 MAG: hypothetical protein CO132_01770 [Candidatus Kerfeldbacteria bacterium CG_4_9_14_3_um_filter_45_8]
MNKPQFTVLIEGAGTATCISLLKGLAVQDEFSVRTVVIDMDDSNAGRYMADAFYATVGSKDDAYVDTVLDICAKEKVDLYIPIIDYGFRKLAAAKTRFAEAGVYLMIADDAAMDVCADKYNTYLFFKENNIPTAETWEAVSNGDFSSVQYPVFIKPRTDGRASLDVYVINNEEELRFHTKGNDNYVMQQLIVGREFTVDCLSSLDGTELVGAVVRERTETKAGVSVKSRMVEPALTEIISGYIKTIVETLKIPGICNIQGFIDENNNVYISEINPRSAGTHVFSIQAGLNSIHRLLQMKHGLSPELVRSQITINPNLKMIRFWDELFIDGETTSTWPPLLK